MTLTKDRRLSDITPVKSSVTEDIKKMHKAQRQQKVGDWMQRARRMTAVAALGAGNIVLIAQNGHMVIANAIALYTASACVVGLILFFGYHK